MSVSREHSVTRIIEGKKDPHYLDDNYRTAEAMVKHCPESAKSYGHRKPYEGLEPIRIPKLSARKKEVNNGESKEN